MKIVLLHNGIGSPEDVVIPGTTLKISFTSAAMLTDEEADEFLLEFAWRTGRFVAPVVDKITLLPVDMYGQVRFKIPNC